MVDQTLSRRGLIAALLAGIGASGALAGTRAALNDTETAITDLSAGTLDLKIDAGDSTVAVLDLSGIRPGESGSGTADLTNDGTLAGALSVDVAVTDDTENRRGGADSTGGELDTALELRGVFGGTTVWAYDTPRALDGTSYTLDSSFGAGATGTFTLDWRLPYAVSLDAPLDETTVTVTFVLS